MNLPGTMEKDDRKPRKLRRVPERVAEREREHAVPRHENSGCSDRDDSMEAAQEGGRERILQGIERPQEEMVHALERNTQGIEQETSAEELQLC